ncbi:hypothetical protein Anas_12693 [Armadillidium nasatum]|uniref:WAP domain-containing protein n=1 Tax=Armadillidium nasatum TaxID=96803 RepID=A0A5N5TGD6_9CRUS|nr:hypothetical protein Anas_12693 [Armadillidium nasatum]
MGEKRGFQIVLMIFVLSFAFVFSTEIKGDPTNIQKVDCPEINEHQRIACEAQILKKCPLNSYEDCWNLAIRCCDSQSFSMRIIIIIFSK